MNTIPPEPILHDQLDRLNRWFAEEGWKGVAFAPGMETEGFRFNVIDHPVACLASSFRSAFRNVPLAGLPGPRYGARTLSRLLTTLTQLGFDVGIKGESTMPDIFPNAQGYGLLSAATLLPLTHARVILEHGVNPNHVATVDPGVSKDGLGAFLPWLFIDIIEEGLDTDHIQGWLDVLDEFGQDWTLPVDPCSGNSLENILHRFRDETAGWSGEYRQVQDFMIGQIEIRSACQRREAMERVIPATDTPRLPGHRL
jgi:hypothetical protein